MPQCWSAHYEIAIELYIENFTIKNWKLSDEKFQQFTYISAQIIDSGYLLELPHRGGSNEYPQSMEFL